MGSIDEDQRILMLDISRVRAEVDRDDDGRARLAITEGHVVTELSGGRDRRENVAGARRLIDQLFLYIELETYRRLAEERTADQRLPSRTASTGEPATADPVTGP